MTNKNPISSAACTSQTCDAKDDQWRSTFPNSDGESQDSDIDVFEDAKFANAAGETVCVDDGISAAKQMIQRSPSFPAGYLQAGKLYSLLGYQRQAMDVYKQGLDNTDRQHHHILRQQYNSAKAKDELRIDIPGLAPYDITASIAEYLANKEPNLELLDVSKTWRSKFAQCPSIWSTIFVNPYNEKRNVDELTRLGHYVGSHVLDFTLYGGTPPYSKALFAGILDGHFGNLVHLSLMYYIAYNNSKLMAALEQISGTLTTLHIILTGISTTTNDDHAFPYKSILSTCQNLECFKFSNHVADISGAATGLLRPGYTSKLKELHIKSQRIKLADLEEILRASPKLRHLELDGFTSAVVDMILSHCKSLEIICLDNEINYIDYYWLDKHRSLNPLQTGVRAITATVDNTANFTRLFAENYSTVEALSLLFNNALLPDQWISFMRGFGNLSNLVLLIIDYTDATASTAVAALIQKSHALRRLEISCSAACDFGSSIASAIVDAPCLQELDIISAEATELNLRTLFQGLAAKGSASQSSLQTVTLASIDCDTRFTVDNILDCLSYIASLRKVEIDQCQPVTESGINRFCEKIRLHPCIEAIALKDLGKSVTDDSLKYLAAIKGLQTLNLASFSSITTQGIRVFDDLPVRLSLSGCRGVTYAFA
ncbi:hypothetical protein BJV82DRAFT_5531 [Fennellomyces sp. T-0311]|nr:hypothetical protein BJV82DRAFT_5531 [Fennellomyces sp. T-0311]